MADENRRLVYSTDGSLPLPEIGRAKKPQPSTAPRLPDDGVVRVAREKRRGSIVTLVHGLPAAAVDETGKVLRKSCGTGGTTKNGIVEVQGDHRDRIVAMLADQGFRVKKAGG
jgi:translation initiation factor 1